MMVRFLSASAESDVGLVFCVVASPMYPAVQYLIVFIVLSLALSACPCMPMCVGVPVFSFLFTRYHVGTAPHKVRWLLLILTLLAHRQSLARGHTSTYLSGAHIVAQGGKK